jgi:nitroimidazol reductase NimA-like FMN-containing flavoprotein (pyridoxamine 5'-phosphate oxidase superfamily)
MQVPDDALTWPAVSSRLAAARNYWLGTTTPSGAPHAAPVWGAVTGGTLCLHSERSTVKARNIAADPRVVDVVYAIRPQSAMMWRLADYAASQRRWSSGP